MTMYCTGKLLNNLPWTKAMSFRNCDDTLHMLLSGECNCKALNREPGSSGFLKLRLMAAMLFVKATEFLEPSMDGSGEFSSTNALSFEITPETSTHACWHTPREGRSKQV